MEKTVSSEALANLISRQFPPYARESVFKLLRRMRITVDRSSDLLRISNYLNSVDSHRRRFEYLTSRMPFPREWFMFDYSFEIPVSYHYYEWYRDFWDYYGWPNHKHEYDPENFRSVVYDYRLPLYKHVPKGESVLARLKDEDFGTLQKFLGRLLDTIDRLYKLVVEEGKVSKVVKQGVHVYRNWFREFYVPYRVVRLATIVPLLSEFRFYIFPSPKNMPVSVVWSPQDGQLTTNFWSVFFYDRAFHKAAINYPVDKSFQTEVTWYVTTFFEVYQPVYFTREGVFHMGVPFDEMVWFPRPQVMLGRGFYIGTEYLRAFYYLYKLSRVIRYVSYYMGIEHYPPPFDKIELVEEDPVAALSFMFLISHWFSYCESPTYRTHMNMRWAAAIDIMRLFQFLPEVPHPPTVFMCSRNFIADRRFEYGLDDLGHAWYLKLVDGAWIHPDLSGIFTLDRSAFGKHKLPGHRREVVYHQSEEQE